MQRIALKFLMIVISSTVVLIAQNATSPGSSTPPPELTEMEKVQVENLQLKQALVNQAINDFQAKYQSVEREIERNHPGWQLQGNGAGFSLVRKQTPAAPTKQDRENQKEVQGAPKPKGP